MTAAYLRNNVFELHRSDLRTKQGPETESCYQISPVNGRLYAQLSRSCPVNYQCFICTESFQSAYCRYKEQQRQVECFNNSKIPTRYKDATIDALEQMVVEKETTAAIRRAAQWIIKWCTAEPLLPKGILLSSQPGTGKSFALAAVLRYLTLVRIKSCLFLEFDHFLMKLKQCYHQKGDELKLYNELREVDVLVIDDLHTRRDSEWGLDVMQRIIGYRYNDMKPLFISTNLELTEQMKSSIPRHTYSRLKEMCYWLSFDGPDRRNHKTA